MISKDGPTAIVAAGPLPFVSCNMTIIRLIVVVVGLALFVPVPVHAATDTAGIHAPLAMNWDCDWDGFNKFWRTQLGKTTGVVGTAAMFVGIGALIICSAKKKT